MPGSPFHVLPGMRTLHVLCNKRRAFERRTPMKANLSARSFLLALLLVLLVGVLMAAAPDQIVPQSRTHNQVIVPGEDRFTPFSQTIRAGDSVLWINMDTDDHTIVSDDALNTIVPR